MSSPAAVLLLWLVAYAYATAAADASLASKDRSVSSPALSGSPFPLFNTSITSSVTTSPASSVGLPGTSISSTDSSLPRLVTPGAPSSLLSSTRTSLCPSRTVNYITHTLPQQCLRTDWVAGRNENGTFVDGATGLNGTAITAVAKLFPTQAYAQGEQYANRTDAAANSATDLAAIEKEQAEVVDNLSDHTAESPTALSNERASEAGLDLGHDSPLDGSKFLSFEEWKKQNLAKVGQSPEALGQARAQNNEPRRRPINNALDTLGDEGEIELDFGGFGEGVSKYAPDTTARATNSANIPTADASADASPVRHRSRDAGKTCKERFNYASFDCAATVLKTNPRCKSSSSVLVENKDSYMLNECSTVNKFIIIELCDDILIDTIVIANFEFFSSMFRTFRVSVSDRYPVKLDRWKDLGTFEARNSREIQAFLIENPLIWARYLRIELISHYGSEFYCPVSLVRVHGTTMMEEFRHQEDIARGDDDSDELNLDVEPQTTKHPLVGVVQDQVVETRTLGTHADGREGVLSKASPQSEVTDASMHIDQTSSSSNLPPLVHNATVSGASNSQASTGPITTSTPLDTAISCTSENKTEPETTSVLPSTSLLVNSGSSSKSSTPTSTGTTSPGPKSSISVASMASNTYATVVDSQTINLTTMVSSNTSVMEPLSVAIPSSGSKGQKSLASEVVRASPAPALQPPTQDSFFKATNKRLMMLETNSSLNIQYIEEQSRILRDAFVQTEKQQLRKTETFLQHLNDTVMTELRGFRQLYDQIWQSTIIELEESRERHQREMSAVSTRLALVADELIWQKRMIVVQSVLLLLSLGLVLFAQKGKEYLDMPLMQQALKRSQGMLRLGGGTRNEAFSLESPTSPTSPASDRESSPVYRKRNSRMLVKLSSPGDESSRPESQGSDVLSAPTPFHTELTSQRHLDIQDRLEDVPRDRPRTVPISQMSGFMLQTPASTFDGHGGDRDHSPSLSPNEAAKAIRREAKSGPSTPSGSRENQPFMWISSEAEEMSPGVAPACGEESEAGASDGTVSPSILPASVNGRRFGRGPSPLRISDTDAALLSDADGDDVEDGQDASSRTESICSANGYPTNFDHTRNQVDGR